LSGVWVGMGVLALALNEAADDRRGLETILSRCLAALMLLVLAIYLISTRDWFGPAIVATPAIAILVGMVMISRTGNRETLVVVGRLAFGAVLPAMPLVLYHVAHGSVRPWLNDIIGAAVGLTQLNFFGQPWYALAVVGGVRNLVLSGNGTMALNGLYWITLSLLPIINGGILWRRLARGQRLQEATVPVIAAFYVIVSLHYQIPIYVYYSSGLCLSAILWQQTSASKRSRLSWTLAAATIAVVAVVFHAGQPHFRTPLQILQGVRRSNLLVAGLDRCSLRLDPREREDYHRLVSMIQTMVPPGGSIFAVPSDAELYFLANRHNPFRFYNTALGIRTDADLTATLDVLAHRPPTIVTYRPKDKYNTDASRRIMEYVRSTYDRLDRIGEVEIYRLRMPA
jgi:hypothetical protein